MKLVITIVLYERKIVSVIILGKKRYKRLQRNLSKLSNYKSILIEISRDKCFVNNIHLILIFCYKIPIIVEAINRNKYFQTFGFYISKKFHDIYQFIFIVSL